MLEILQIVHVQLSRETSTCARREQGVRITRDARRLCSENRDYLAFYQGRDPPEDTCSVISRIRPVRMYLSSSMSGLLNVTESHDETLFPCAIDGQHIYTSERSIDDSLILSRGASVKFTYVQRAIFWNLLRKSLGFFLRMYF